MSIVFDLHRDRVRAFAAGGDGDDPAFVGGRLGDREQAGLLEGLADLSARNLPAPDMAEALRPLLVPLLLQQMTPINVALPLVTLDPELEQLLIRSRRPQGEEGLMLDTGLTGTLVSALGEALEAAVGQGKQPVVIVASVLRRAFAHFLRPPLPDAIVLGINELPESRRVEVLASIGGQQQLAFRKAEE